MTDMTEMTDPSTWIDALAALEADIRYRVPPEPGSPWFRVDEGTLPVLISAPHAAGHTRRGAFKEEDEYTASIARLLARQTGAHAIYTCCLSPDDANWDRDVPYKHALRDHAARHAIRFVLDLHGCAGTRPFGLALGTLRGQSGPGERDQLLACLAHEGFHPQASSLLDTVDVDRTFRAEGSTAAETITRYAWQSLGLPAAQLEIHPSLRIAHRLSGATSERPFDGDAPRILRLLHALTAFLLRFANQP